MAGDGWGKMGVNLISLGFHGSSWCNKNLGFRGKFWGISFLLIPNDSYPLVICYIAIENGDL